MRIAVARETAPGELRVALVPESVQRLTRAGHTIRVESGAGVRAGALDADYRKAGAEVHDGRAAALEGAELWAHVRRPTLAELESAPEGSALASMVGVEAPEPLLPVLASRRLTFLALERVPAVYCEQRE